MPDIPDDDELSTLLDNLEVESPPPIKTKKIQESSKGKEKEEVSVPEHSHDPEPKQNDDDENDPDLASLYNSSLDELLSNYRKDRKDLDNYIKMLYDRLSKSEPSRVLFESLATTLRTKCESNSNLIKLLDSINKRMDKSGGGEDLDLDTLLDD